MQAKVVNPFKDSSLWSLEQDTSISYYGVNLSQFIPRSVNSSPNQKRRQLKHFIPKASEPYPQATAQAISY